MASNCISDVQDRLQRLQASINAKIDAIEDLEAKAQEQQTLLIHLQHEEPSAKVVSLATLELAQLEYELAKLDGKKSALLTKLEDTRASINSLQTETDQMKSTCESLLQEALEGTSTLINYKNKVIGAIGSQREVYEMALEDLRSYHLKMTTTEAVQPATNKRNSVKDVVPLAVSESKSRKLLERMQFRKREQQKRLNKLKEEYVRLSNQIVT